MHTSPHEARDLLVVAEVASVLRVDPATVRRLIVAGDLSASRVGKGYRVERSDLDAYLDRSRVTPALAAGT